MFWAAAGEIAGPGPSPGLRISASRFEALGFREAARSYYRFWKPNVVHFDTFPDPSYSHISGVPLWRWLLLDVNRDRNQFFWMWSQGMGDVALMVTKGEQPSVVPSYQQRCRSCGQVLQSKL